MGKLQVLVATMEQNDLSKVKQMNIFCDAIIANQANTNDYIENKFSFGTVKMITTQTKGVGINRNMALLYADGDILLFSDDDMAYDNDYVETVLTAFKELPNADAIIFNIKPLYHDSSIRINHSIKRLKWYNALNYGVVRMAVKSTSIRRENIMFNRCFGGGTSFSSGEDSIFIMDMLRKGLKIYTYPKQIAVLDNETVKSTWFKGYNEKYFYDKGLFFRCISRNLATFLCLQDLIRHVEYKESGMTFLKAFRLMKNGIKGFNNLIEYKNI